LVKSPILYWLINDVASRFILIFFKPVAAPAPAPVSYYNSVPLQQGRVRIASNAECKNKDGLSKYVTDTTTCVNSNKRFTCPVSKWFSQSIPTFIYTCVVF
jgi:hypothetical protein